MRKRRLVMMLVVVAMVIGVMTPAAMAAPKCADDFLGAGWDNHANHIIEQYLLGLGDPGVNAVDMPPNEELGGGQLDPATVIAFAGAAGRGHLAGGFPPGASFCP